MNDDAYQARYQVKAIEQMSERLEPLEDLPTQVQELYNALDFIGTQLERIATVMELNSDRHQEKLRQEAAKRNADQQRWLAEHGHELMVK